MQSTLRVQLEVLNGPVKGQRVIVSPEAPLVVGRASGLGLSIADDPTVSRHHFQIDLTPPDCRLTSLSPNGTWVNQDEVTEIVLFDGDEIRIGCDSVFRVRMLNDYVADSQPTRPQFAHPGLDAPPEAYLTQTCQSGLTRFSGGADAPAAPQFVQRLAQKGKLYAIVDFRRLGLKPPATLKPDAGLFDWLPPDLMLENSPLFMEAAGPEFIPLLEVGWGRDAMVLVHGQAEPAEVFAHLKHALKLNPQGKPNIIPGAFLGICWPGILDQLLSNGSAGLIESLLQGIDAVLLESAESPSQWQVLAREPFSEVLQELGLVPETSLKGRKTKQKD